jgi:hypothetical protein
MTLLPLPGFVPPFQCVPAPGIVKDDLGIFFLVIFLQVIPIANTTYGANPDLEAEGWSLA